MTDFQRCPGCGAPAADWQGSITCQGQCGWCDTIGYDVKFWADPKYVPRPWFFPRKGEWWFGKLGIFWHRDLRGIELPSGRWVKL